MSKILIVDDDVAITELMKVLLTMEGHQLSIVNDSTQALDVANSIRPDLIVLDLMMPGLTGFQLCELLHQDSGFASIPILIVSARDDPESRQRALQSGAREYLTKPFEVNQLLQKINDLIHL